MTRRGNTTQRSIRIDAELWARIRDQAAAEGLDVSTLVRQLLRGWLDSHDHEGEKMSEEIDIAKDLKEAGVIVTSDGRLVVEW